MSSKITNEYLINKISQLEKKAEDLAKKIITSKQEESILQELADRLSLLVTTQESLLQQYQKNMSAFQHFDKGVYNFFANYQPVKYKLDIVDGFANIYNEVEQQHVYQYPPFLMALAQLAEYKENPQSTRSAFEINEENNNDFIHSKYLNEIIRVLENRIENEQGKNKELPNVINSLVLFGTGVGYHIELLVNQHKINNLYIVEPELDLFYASLYTANWADILDKLDRENCNLHLSIGMQKDDFFNDLLEQTYQNGRYNIVKTFGYIHYKTALIGELLITFKERFKEMIQGWGFFDDGVMAIAHTLGNLNNEIALLKKSVKNSIKNHKVPVFVVGNGPSLDSSIEQIKLHQDKAIVISCGSALSALMKYGISVDFHCEQERTYPVVEKVKEYGDLNFVKQHILLAPSTVHPGVFELFERGIMCPKSREPSTEIILTDTEVKDIFEASLFVNPTVANTAVAMGYLLGYRQFYLFGVDLGHKKGGNHHSQKSLYYSESGDDLSLYKAKNTDNIVSGNFGGEFVCNDFFNMSRRSIEKLLNTYEDVNCFNLSDGAKIKGAITLKEVNFLEKDTLNKAEHLDDVYASARWQDNNKALYYRLLDKAAPKQVFDVCNKLKKILDDDINTIQEGVDMLRAQTRLCIKLSSTGYAHVVSLFDGTLLHYQAMLTRILYEAEEIHLAINDFNKAKVYFCKFLIEAPDFYKANYNLPRVSNINWWDGSLKVR